MSSLGFDPIVDDPTDVGLVVEDILDGHPFSNFPLYFFKVAILRFNTVLDTNATLRHCWRSLRVLRMFPIDSGSNSTLNGMFASHFRKRSLTKIQKMRKNLPGR